MPSDETTENLVVSTTDATQENVVPDSLDNRVAESKHDVSEDQIRGILEVIASTGKFWLDWEKLKVMLSIQLKQVLSEYPEALMTADEQTASLGETYPELVKRLDEALLSFHEGPPFTFQRICEILHSARSIYPKLSKLALALEKNLLVTSMLSVSSDPSLQAPPVNPDEANATTENREEASEETEAQPNSLLNGAETTVGDKDEIMTEVEETVDMSIDAEANNEIVRSTETCSTPTES